MKKSLFNFSFRSLLSLILMLMMATSILAIGPSTNSSLLASFTTSGFTNPIEISDLKLFDGAHTSTTLATQLTPRIQNTGEYTVGFTVADLDGLKGMDLKVVLYNDSTGEIEPADLEATTVNGDVLVFTWDQGGVNTEENQNEPKVIWTTSVSNSWEIKYNNCQDGFKLDNNPKSFTFSFSFLTSSIAVASKTWKLYVEVATDETIPDTDSIELDESLTMSWLGQIELQADSETPPYHLMSWGNGGSIAHDAKYASTYTTEIVKYFSNGAFDTWASAGGTWDFYEADNVGGVDGYVTLKPVPTATGERGELGIRINTTSTNGSTDGYKQLSDWVTVESDLDPTNESGIEQTYYFYLQLEGAFRNGTYSGTVSIGITNHIDVVE
jgi:hypothetical protein